MNPRSSPTSRVALVLALLLAPVASQATERSKTADPGGHAVELNPPAPPARGHARRAIFVCHDANGAVFSDRPCGAVIENREIAFEESSGTAPSTTPRPATARPLPRKAAAVQPPVDTDDRGCRRLRDRLDALDDRMRAGYSARESARLWQQWRELKRQIHERRC
jgi:hypothetical protein